MCSVNSFTAATPVLLADGRKIPISQVEEGDRVVATDPETGETADKPVVELIVHDGDHTMVEVTLSDGSSIDATDEHPFWAVSEEVFVFAIDLEVGDVVLTADGGLLAVTGVRVYTADIHAYNLAIADIHTFYAGHTPVLVHNTCASQALTHAAEGIKPYSVQSRVTAGRGGEIQAHHLVEKRFANVFPGQSTNDWATVVVTREEHQIFTNSWRQAIPYGAGTRGATPESVQDAARTIYANYPTFLRALGLP